MKPEGRRLAQITALLLVGLGLWWALGSSGKEKGETRELAAPELEAEAAQQAAFTRNGAASSEIAPGGSASAAAAAESGRQRKTDATVLEPGQPFVRVRDRESGQPVAHATLYWMDQGRYDAARWQELREEAVDRPTTPEGIAREMALAFGGVFETDLEGRAAIPELRGPSEFNCWHGDKRGLLMLIPEAFAKGMREGDPLWALRADRLEYPLWLDSPKSLDVRLIGANGKAIEAATLELRFGERSHERMQLDTDAAGRCTFQRLQRAERESKMRPWILRPVVIGGAPVQRELHPEALPEDELLLRLPAMGRIQIECHAHRRHQAQATAQLLLETLSQPSVLPVELTVRQFERLELVRLGQRFRLSGTLLSGEAVEPLEFRGPERSGQIKRVVVRPLEAGGLALSGRLVESSGMPAAGRILWCVRDERGSRLGPQRRVHVDRHASFYIAVPPDRRAAMRSIEFVLAPGKSTPPQALRVPLHVSSPKTTRKKLGRLVLQPLPVLVAGHARTKSGDPLFGEVRVHAIQRRTAGKQRVEPLPATWSKRGMDGSFVVHAKVPDELTELEVTLDSDDARVEPVRCSPGATDLLLLGEALGRIQLSFVAPHPGAQWLMARLIPSGRAAGAWTRVSNPRFVRFTGLSQGTYTLELRPLGAGQALRSLSGLELGTGGQVIDRRLEADTTAEQLRRRMLLVQRDGRPWKGRVQLSLRAQGRRAWDTIQLQGPQLHVFHGPEDVELRVQAKGCKELRLPSLRQATSLQLESR